MLYRSQKENPEKGYMQKTAKFIIRSGGTIMKASCLNTGSFQKNPQTQFVTKELLKEAITEYFQENPEALKGAIKTALKELKTETEEAIERIDTIILDQAKDRRRISNLELLLGLDESLQDPKSPFFEDNTERYKQLFLNSIFSNMVQTQETGNVHNLLYSELKKVPSMRNKDVINFMGWEKRNTMKATRIMKEMPKIYSDVICDYAPGKKRALRIYIKH